MDDVKWYWCLRHGAPEPEDGHCPPDQRLGPYPSREAAEHWKEQFEARNQAWDEEDARWEGDEAST